MAPASAGSNGTVVEKHSNMSRAQIFAHTRAGEEGSTAILLSGVALAPPEAPPAVQGVINAANTIVGRPYIWGGGHAVLLLLRLRLLGLGQLRPLRRRPDPRTAHLRQPRELGRTRPRQVDHRLRQRHHTFIEIAGLRWDTVGDARGTGPRWHLEPTSTAGFVARHPPGL